MYKHKLTAIASKMLRNKISGIYTDIVGSRVEVTLLSCFLALHDMITNKRDETFIIGASADEPGQLLLHKILFKILEETGFNFTFKKVRKQQSQHRVVTYGVDLYIENIEDCKFWTHGTMVFIGTKEDYKNWELEDKEDGH